MPNLQSGMSNYYLELAIDNAFNKTADSVFLKYVSLDDDFEADDLMDILENTVLKEIKIGLGIVNSSSNSNTVLSVVAKKIHKQIMQFTERDLNVLSDYLSNKNILINNSQTLSAEEQEFLLQASWMKWELESFLMNEENLVKWGFIKEGKQSAPPITQKQMLLNACKEGIFYLGGFTLGAAFAVGTIGAAPALMLGCATYSLVGFMIGVYVHHP